MNRQNRHSFAGVVLLLLVAVFVWSGPRSVSADANETAVNDPNASSQASISGDLYHTCALLSTGAATCWGRNNYGQLGDGTLRDSHEPVQVFGLTSGVTAISGGGINTCALLSTGAAKCWGRNTHGQLGNGSNANTNTPTQVTELTSGVTAISGGTDHTCAIQNGTAKCWGKNTYGQLGNDTVTDSNTPVQVTGLTSGVTAITAGTFHTCAIQNGAAKCWGRNTYGQLGNSTVTDSNTPVQVSGLIGGVTAITAGDLHTCAIQNGAASCWGAGGDYQLGGLSMGTNKETPIQVSQLTSGVIAITAGAYHTCALLDTGAAKCWGGNSYGQLGTGANTGRSIPTAVSGLTSGVTAITAGAIHTCALLWTGAAKCWGDNGWGRLGDGTTTDSNIPVQVTGLTSGVGVSPTLTITYDTHGGNTVSDGDTSTTTGATISALPTDPTRTGYTFNGWYTAASGGTQITTSSPHAQTADFTLHAQWNANTLTISYDSHSGSTVSDGDTSTTTGGTISALPTNPTRTGYTFNGWYTAASGGTQITTSSPHGQTANFTLHAQWTADTPTTTTPVVVLPPAPGPTTPPTTTVAPTTSIPEPEPPGNASATTSNGDEISSTIEQVKTTERVVFTIRNSDGTELTVTHEPNRIRTAFDVDSGSIITVTGSGYQPGTDITVWLYSTPTRLGVTSTDDRGQFATDLTIPADFAIGSHTLSIAGTTARGTNTTRIGITINSPALELPVTGTRSDTPLGVALMLVVFGILARVRVRRLN